MRGSSKLASSFPFQLLKDRWSVVVVSFFIMSCAGATYMFGLYSGVIKKALSYDQETLDTLGFFKDLGANVGIISGLLNEVVVVIENQIRISIDIYRAMAAITVLIIVLNVGFVIKDLGERRRGVKDPSPKEVELGGSNNGSEESKLSEKASDPNAQIAHQDVEVLPSTNNSEEHRSKWPKRGDDFTIPQALISLDMWILFIATTCGVGAALTAIDNLGQIGESLGYLKTSISTFVSLVSFWNFLGRVVAGCVSQIRLQGYKLPRPLMMSAVLGIACVSHLLIAFGMPRCLYVASIIIRFFFGAQ